MMTRWVPEQLYRSQACSLTPHEERVLDLVATGRTNRAVAVELRVSLPSVESALARIYAKLDDGSRTGRAWDRRVCAVLWWHDFARQIVDVVEDL